MSQLLKRVASSAFGTSEDESHVKVAKSDSNEKSEVKSNEATGVDSDLGSSKSGMLKDDSDDDLFGELTDTVNREIGKACELEIGVKYELVDIYGMRIDGRFSVVGGFTREGNEKPVYIWLPSSMSRNLTEAGVLKLKSKLDCGKKAFGIYYGMKPNKYG
ncbi:ATP synthase subunit a, partial [Frankliniella fusca]